MNGTSFLPNESTLRKAWDQKKQEVEGYHIHIYFNDFAEEIRAREVVQDLLAMHAFSIRAMDDVDGTGFHPHSVPNIRLRITEESFAEIVQGLQLHHRGLSILVHPETGDDLKDHLENSLWIHKETPYNQAFFDALKERRNNRAPKAPTPK